MKNIGFEYKYKKVTDIFNNIIDANNLGIYKYLVILGVLVLFIALIFILIPILKNKLDLYIKTKGHKKRKKMLKNMIKAKEIENEINKEFEDKRKADIDGRLNMLG